MPVIAAIFQVTGLNGVSSFVFRQGSSAFASPGIVSRGIVANALREGRFPSYLNSMNLFTRLCLSFLLVSGIVPAGAVIDGEDVAPETLFTNWEGKALVVPLSGDVFGDGRSGRDLERLLVEAELAKVAGLVFEINISESADIAAQNRLLDRIARLTVPTIAYVNTSATGSGALIALATDTIYLNRGGIIGGAGLRKAASKPAAPGDDAAGRSAADENLAREESILKARARSVAGTKGHRPEVAEAFIDAAVEVRIGETVISEKGQVLTLTAEEAVREYEGKPLLAKGIVDSIEAILLAEGLGTEFERLSPRAYGELTSRTKLTRSDGKDEAGADGGVVAGAEKAAGDLPLFGRRDATNYKGKVVVLKVGQDTLATGKASFDFMDRTLKKAELDGATAVVFDMDTPGGFAWYTEGLVLTSLQNVSIPTYTFVNPRAESAGAIIAMGTDHIYMRPAATIGSALVVSGTGQDLNESMADKVTQMIIGTVRNVAELKGHNPDVAEAFVTREKEVRIDGVLVHEAGNVLNLNTVRATEIIGGRPVLAKGVARDLKDLVGQESLTGEIVEATPLGMEAFAHWVQKLSFLLIIVGLAGAYLEMNTPGFGFPGIVSVCAFSLFFFGNYLAGNLAGYELFVLLVAGLILIAVEIFIFPGTIVAGLAGSAMVLAALGLAMVDRVDLEWKWGGMPGSMEWSALFQSSLISLAAGMVGALVVILLGMRFLPGTRLGSRFVLAGAVPTGASLPGTGGSGSVEGAKAFTYLGLTGSARTDLRPSGKAEFGGRLLDVISDGEFIPRGEPLKVIRHEGSRVVVAKDSSG
jgi:membrane-bound serine protease (ClpP class)